MRGGYAISPLDGTPLFYEVSEPADTSAGHRPPLVLCDGIGCDGYVWKYLRRDLAGAHRILHGHYRGHGRSLAPRDPACVAISDLADDLVAVMDDAAIDRGVLLGHSMGVQVVLETYRRHPQRVLALILLCGAPENPLKTFRGSDALERILPRVRAAVDRVPRLAWAVTRAVLPTKLSYSVAAKLEINAQLLHESDFMPYLRGLGRIDPRLFLGMLAEAGAHSAVEVLSTIEVPTLIVGGAQDGFTPASLSESMHRAVADAELLMVEDGSHTAPIERPRYVNGAIREFLERRLNRQH